MFDAAEDRRLNQETDARTNHSPQPLSLLAADYDGLAALRQQWATLPMVPRLVVDRHDGIDNSWPEFDIRTMLVGEESAGRFAIHNVIMAPGAALPPHHLRGADTYWIVLDGDLEMTVGGHTQIVRRDAFGYVPEDTSQAIRNISDRPANFFLWHSPAGPELAFAAAHKLWQDRPDASREDYLQMLAPFGFEFHREDVRLQNDDRTNIPVLRIEAQIESFADFASLRRQWMLRQPVPKLVQDRNQVLDIAVPGQETKVLLNGDEDSGRCAIFYCDIIPGFYAPPHHQPTEEEIFLVLDGTLELTAGNVTSEVPRGGIGFAPRYGTHGFRNSSTSARTRMITMNSPAGHERGFEMIARDAGSDRFSDLLVAHGWRMHEAYEPNV